MVLLWWKGVGAVVPPHSNLLGTGPDELETAVQTLLQSEDQIVGWRTKIALQEEQDFTHVGLGSGSFELAVRFYRNSSLCEFNKLSDYYYFIAIIIGVDWGGIPGTRLPITEKRLCFHQIAFYPHFPQYLGFAFQYF